MARSLSRPNPTTQPNNAKGAFAHATCTHLCNSGRPLCSNHVCGSNSIYAAPPFSFVHTVFVPPNALFVRTMFVAQALLVPRRLPPLFTPCLWPHRKYPGNLDDRVFAVYSVWKEDPDSSTIIVAFGDITNPSDLAAANAVVEADPRASKAIRGGTRAPQAERVK